MIGKIHDALFGYIVPSLTNQSLSSFALVSHKANEICKNEITKRSEENRSRLHSYFYLNGQLDIYLSDKVSTYLPNQWNPVAVKIAIILQRFIQDANFTFLPSEAFERELWGIVKDKLDILDSSEIIEDFFMQLQAGHEDQGTIQGIKTIQGAMTLLEKYEGDKEQSSALSKRIRLNVNQLQLSVGNLVCLELIKKRLGIYKDLLGVFDQFNPSSLYNTEGHAKITLIKTGNTIHEAWSEDSRSHLVKRVETLSELRLLEIEQRENYDSLTRSCFQSVLASASTFTKLKSVIFNLREVSDNHIEDISNAITEIVKQKDAPFSLITLQCADISLRQMSVLTTQINSHLSRKIEIDLGVYYRTCQHLEELQQVEQLSTNYVVIKFRMII